MFLGEGEEKLIKWNRVLSLHSLGREARRKTKIEDF